MNVDPTTISLIALCVSILSLLISVFQMRVDRGLQWEQLRGSLQTRLTIRCIEILALVDKITLNINPDSLSLIQKLTRMVEELVALRRDFRGLKNLGIGKTLLLTKITAIKSDLDDADPVFDKLRLEISENDLVKANKTADGLLQRIFGSKSVGLTSEHK